MQILKEIKEIYSDKNELEVNLGRTDDELFALREARRKILDQKKMIKDLEQKDLVEKVKSEVKNKVAKGKNLSWEELKIMFKDEAKES